MTRRSSPASSPAPMAGRFCKSGPPWSGAYELQGRPDGQRPHKMESALDYQRARCRRQKTPAKLPASRSTPTTVPSCLRKACSITSGTSTSSNSTTGRASSATPAATSKRSTSSINMPSANRTACTSNNGAYLLRMHFVARAMIDWEANRHSTAWHHSRGPAKLEALPECDVETFQYERQRSSTPCATSPNKSKSPTPERGRTLGARTPPSHRG